MDEVQKKPMSESRQRISHRLCREGRWEEASIFKDETIAALRKSGMKKVEAGEEAWRIIAEKFPPLPVEEQPPDIEPDTLERFTEARPDLVRDILWVYERLEDKRTKPEDAPSLGSWSMLKWARDYRNRFFEQVLPKALAKKAEAGGTEETAEEAAPGMEEVERMLKQMMD